MQFSILVVFLKGFLPLKKGLNPTEGHLVIIILPEENNIENWVTNWAVVVATRDNK